MRSRRERLRLVGADGASLEAERAASGPETQAIAAAPTTPASVRPVLVPTCELVAESISARLDDEEAPLPPATVDRHLRACDACRAFAAGVGVTKLAGSSAAPVPDRLVSRLVAQATRGAGARRSAGSGAAARRQRVPEVARWVAAAIPLAIAAPTLALGSFTHVHVVRSPTPSPCEAHVHPAQLPTGRPAPL